MYFTLWKPVEEIKAVISVFFVGINHFMKETVKNCKRDGFVQTILGRRRYLPGIKDNNPYHKAHVC